MTAHYRILLTALFMAGLGGALLSSSILAGATLLLAVAGGVMIARKQPQKTGWETPKELRLLHFAFWFFSLIGILNLSLEGFEVAETQNLLPIVFFLIFWPLVVALSQAELRAKAVFLAVGLAAFLTIVSFIAGEQSAGWPIDQSWSMHAVGDANSATFGNIALLIGTMTFVAASFERKTGKKSLALLFVVAGICAITLSLLAESRSNMVAMPVFLLTLLPLLNRKLQLAGVLLAVLMLSYAFLFRAPALTLPAGFDSMMVALSWLLLIAIPLSIFLRQLFNEHVATAHLAVIGTQISTALLIFSTTSASTSVSLLLVFFLLATAGVASALFEELNASYCRHRKYKVSATIITKNEEAHIADCLRSARQVADEIIVLDSGSSDNTVEIARQHADLVEVTDWPGFGIQKQRALEKATGEWVLSLDADERITPELAREINHHLAAPDADAYKLPWAVTIYGKRLDFGRSGRAPLRLFRREGVRFSDALVHERILIPEGRKVKTLRGRLTHYTHRDFGHSLEKSAKYAWLGSLEKHRRGKKTRTMIYPTLRGLMTFVQVYFLRFGFLDGAVGYLTAVTYAQVTFNKYAGLWTLDRPSYGDQRRSPD
ncbi:glycosyltransferase family 2 protein [Marinobacter sp.]|uniref:glycosyltransferase family 2 protein n=1 Tax=Marinobacter sp. TaxID=50741 RepID=UPI0035C72564